MVRAGVGQRRPGRAAVGGYVDRVLVETPAAGVRHGPRQVDLRLPVRRRRQDRGARDGGRWLHQLHHDGVIDGPAQAGITPNPDSGRLGLGIFEGERRAGDIQGQGLGGGCQVGIETEHQCSGRADEKIGDRIVGTVISKFILRKKITATCAGSGVCATDLAGAQVFHRQRGRQDVGLRLRGCAEAHQRGARQRGGGEGAEASAVGARQRLCAGRGRDRSGGGLAGQPHQRPPPGIGMSASRVRQA